MTRFATMLLVAWSVMPTTLPAATRAPIRTQAELQHYLQVTPAAATPLAALPPASRKRFLGQLRFLPHGVDINFSEPAAELTHAQVTRLYALFGQTPPTSIGLTAEQQQRRARERDEEARQRHCIPTQCPESAVERRFDEFSAIAPRFDLADAERFAAEKQDYDRLFGTFFHPPASLDDLGAPDLRLLARALATALYAAPDDRHIAQLQRVLRHMQQRGMAEDRDFEPLYDAEVATRQFGAADTLRAAHPAMQVVPLPTFIPGPAPAVGQPTVLSLDTPSGTMRRRAIDLHGPLRIVVIAGCHFSEDAARAIRDDPALHALFARRALWLTAPTQAIGDVPAWNREFPDFPMQVAWNRAEWAMLPSWAMPTYYVYRDGHLSGQFAGWLGTAALKQSLHAAGAL